MSFEKPFTPPNGLTLTHGHYENDDYVFFWGGPFSNWAPSPFSHHMPITITSVDGHSSLQLRGTDFNCAEQALMWAKALSFNDAASADKIMNTSDPREQKRLGRMVTNYDDPKWVELRYDIMCAILDDKFADNPTMLEILIGTGDKHIVEASPYDAVWGIAMGVDHPDLLDETKWRGENLLGKALMEVRGQSRT